MNVKSINNIYNIYVNILFLNTRLLFLLSVTIYYILYLPILHLQIRKFYFSPLYIKSNSYK